MNFVGKWIVFPPFVKLFCERREKANSFFSMFKTRFVTFACRCAFCRLLGRSLVTNKASWRSFYYICYHRGGIRSELEVNGEEAVERGRMQSLKSWETRTLERLSRHRRQERREVSRWYIWTHPKIVLSVCVIPSINKRNEWTCRRDYFRALRGAFACLKKKKKRLLWMFACRTKFVKSYGYATFLYLSQVLFDVLSLLSDKSI